MIKNILFDFAETIAELKPSREDILEDFLLKKNITLSRKKINQVYNYVDINLPYSSVNINNIEDKNRFYLLYNYQMFTMLGLVHISDNIEKEFLDFFLSIEKHWTIKDNLLDALVELKNKGYSLSLISNFDLRLKDILNKLRLNEIFDYIYISQEVGLEKPNVEFYKTFFEYSKYKISETIYVGDSYLLDYLPAQAIGLPAVLLDENDLYPHIKERIVSILDIKKKLEGNNGKN